MKPGLLAFVLLSVAATLLGQSLPVSLFKPLAAKKLSSPAAQADPAIRSTAVATYGSLPLAFEANQGQINPQVKFLSRGVGYSLFLTPTEAVLTLGRVSRQKPGSAGKGFAATRREICCASHEVGGCQCQDATLWAR
jgi:hypothetical protein